MTLICQLGLNAQSKATIKTGKESSVQHSSQNSNEQGVYLHVESGTKTPAAITFEDQISKYDIEKIKQLENAYQIKYDQNKNESDNSPEYLKWSADILNKLSQLQSRKSQLQSNQTK